MTKRKPKILSEREFYYNDKLLEFVSRCAETRESCDTCFQVKAGHCKRLRRFLSREMAAYDYKQEHKV